MSLREKLLRVAPEEWENEFVRPPRPDRYDPRRRDAHAGGRAPGLIRFKVELLLVLAM